MDVDVARLAGMLDQLAELLAAHSETRWAEWVRRDAVLLRRGDGHGVIDFLGAFGGMGSLNDVQLAPADDGTASGRDAADANRRFRDLRSAAWQLANELRQEAEAR